MFFSSQKPRLNRTMAAQFLAALSARPAAALLVTPLVHLWSGPLILGKNTTIANLVAAEVAFDGYAPIALPTLSTPLNVTDTVIALLANVLFTFVHGAGNVGTAAGYWIDHNTGADWVLAETLPGPAPFSANGDFLDLDILIPTGLLEQAA